MVDMAGLDFILFAGMMGYLDCRRGFEVADPRVMV